MEEKLFLDNNGIPLEGILSYPENTSEEKPVAIFPPHPKLGGNIENNVVTALSSSLSDAGFLTGRFNYRGVGKSGMEIENTTLFDYWENLDSSGDFTNIISDAAIITDKLMKVSSAKTLCLAGYSFGTRIAAEFCEKSFTEKAVFISPPLSFYDYSFLSCFKGSALFIIAENDICLSEDELISFIDKTGIKGKIKVIDGEDHFYRESEEKIAKLAVNFLQEG